MASVARKNIEEPQELTIPQHPELRKWVERVRKGAPVSDSAFDQLFPVQIQSLSPVHWTPIEVTRRVMDYLVDGRIGCRVLDVGCGVGKFCLVGALISGGQFFGIEQRKHFCELARTIAERYGIHRVNFLTGNLRDLDWSPFDSIYLFNPFQENKTPRERLDDTVPLSQELYRTYISATINKLALMPRGTRVATYHGFGGAFPASYAREHAEWCHRGPLEFWIKFR